MLKNRVNKIFSFILLFLFSISFFLFAKESKKDLLAKQDKIQKEIAYTNRLIEETSKKKKNSLQELSLVNRKISRREKLIESYRISIDILQIDINKEEEVLASLKRDLAKEKQEYSKLIYDSYKYYNKHQEFLFLLASNSFNQLYSRFKYQQQYNQHRSTKLILIKKLNIVVENRIVELISKRKEKVKQYNILISERNLLSNERDRRGEIIQSLSKEEEKLKKDLKEKQKAVKEINKKIEQMLTAELKKNKYEKLTPEQQLISSDFEKNKGFLPWPTSKGVITEKFGEHNHPVLRDIKVRNYGIDITTSDDTDIRAIFSGVVTAVSRIKGQKYTIIIRHGNYFSVYHNISNVSVNKGDEVSTKQVIGLCKEDSTNENVIVHFQLYKDKVRLNPEDWISN